ncbi:hypothetical protein OOU_Y34scaffold00287g3 [Pyricularia oryzae Y34]|uniref:Carrier domain-containing protein n=2 Tax=Pyricularia oryzae TaxID=318829 RepID=A0AA97P3E5_PYRO3|nr:hypothetical protein OOU_Y34scaffold00287g3 [Pyricularia oryzae Y34]
MLTSDSTGNAKAVELSHAQILAAVAGKTSIHVDSLHMVSSPGMFPRSAEQASGIQVVRAQLLPDQGGRLAEIVLFPPPAHGFLALLKTDEIALQTCMLTTGSRPHVFLLRDASLPFLPVSTLGRISRVKMRNLFDDGVFDPDVAVYDRAVWEARQVISSGGHLQDPTGGDTSLMRDVAETLEVSVTAIWLDSPFYSPGITSIDLIRLKNRIDKRLGTALPIIILMKHPTVREFAASLEMHVGSCDRGATYNENNVVQGGAVPYDPVVAFQTARGFDHGPQPFRSIAEARDIYLAAIRQRQPRGPYALAGYSYGTMLAFEVSKALEAAGEAVAFLGSFNLPPHIKHRMQQLSRNACLLHLAHFLALVTEGFADEKEGDQTYLVLPPADALRYILDASDNARLQDLALSEQDLDRWVDVAFGLQGMAADYEPEDIVAGIDVFHAIPLRAQLATKKNESTFNWPNGIIFVPPSLASMQLAVLTTQCSVQIMSRHLPWN